MAGAYDAIVLGLGATGSATLFQLARRGARVLGIDQYSPPHAFGSSHGETRVTRLAIGEGAHYTPLARRSHALWREIESQTGESLLTSTGALIVSGGGDRAVCHVPGFFDNTLAAAREHGIAHELLDADAIRARFPQFAVRDDDVGYFEPEAGFLRPEACIRAQLDLAAKHGAAIHGDEPASGFAQENGTAVVTTQRAAYRAGTLILAAGPWLPELLGEPWSRLFTITRQVLFWFDVEPAYERFRLGNFPVFLWQPQGRAQPLYGFPAIDGPAGGMKIGSEQFAATTTPRAIERGVAPSEAAALHADLIAPHLPGVGTRCLRSATCLYTATADSHFVIDRHPRFASVIVASPCSGHGFKHSAALGEALAQLVLENASTLDLSAFSWRPPAGAAR